MAVNKNSAKQMPCVTEHKTDDVISWKLFKLFITVAMINGIISQKNKINFAFLNWNNHLRFGY